MSMLPAAFFAWLALVGSASASVGVPASPRVWSELVSGDTCDVTSNGAIGDNKTDSTAAIIATIASCTKAHPSGAVVHFPGPGTYRVGRSIALRSNLTLVIGPGATIFSAKGPKDAVTQDPACPVLYWPHFNTAILCGTNISNIAIVGAGMHSSLIDGGGWAWYIPGWYANHSLGGRGPRGFEVAWSTNITLSNIGFVNSPAWTVHPTFSEGVLADSIMIKNPRAVGNTDGFDPDSCKNVVLRHSVIDTGDDGISIKSGNSSACRGCVHIQMPSQNVHIYNTTVLSRNVCLGSATYGGIMDLVVEDCTIGDDEGSSPWAIKYKSHQSYPGTLKNHTWRRLKVGNIQSNTYQQPNAGYFMSIELRYHPLSPKTHCGHGTVCPRFEGVVFEDITIKGAQRAGDINGFEHDPLYGLTFRNVTFETAPKQGWTCGYVDLETFSATDVSPMLKCAAGPAHVLEHGDAVAGL